MKTKSCGFALRIIKLYKYIVSEKKEFVLSKQIFKIANFSGTNVEEANQGQSKSDFIHKLSIAQKEAFETDYWLRLLRDSGVFNQEGGRILINGLPGNPKNLKIFNKNH